MALPSIYDLTNPESNLADPIDCGCGRGLSCADCAALSGLAADAAASTDPLQSIMNFSVRLSASLLAGVHGYRRGGALQGLLWALAGSWFPFPTAGVAVYQTATAEQRGAAARWGRTLPQRLRHARGR